MKRGICFVVSVTLLLLCGRFRVVADEVAEHEKLDTKIAQLASQIELKLDEGEFGDAEKLTLELTPLEVARYGADNWRIHSGNVIRESFSQMARLPPDDTKRVRRALSMLEIAVDRFNEFKLADALRLYEGGKETLDQVVGEGNYFANDAASHYARTLSLMGEHEKAKRVSIKATDISLQMFGSDSVYSANATAVLGEVYARAGMLKEAEDRLRAADQLYVKLFDGELVKNRLPTTVHLAEILNDSERFQEAESLARTAVKIAEQQKPTFTLLSIRAHAGLARSLHGQGKLEAAQDEFAELMGIVADLPIPQELRVDLINRYVNVLEDLGRTKEADKYREEVRELTKKRASPRTETKSEDELAVPPE
jgi:tetratricopeptide (TPR) repeat protein